MFCLSFIYKVSLCFIFVLVFLEKCNVISWSAYSQENVKFIFVVLRIQYIFMFLSRVLEVNWDVWKTLLTRVQIIKSSREQFISMEVTLTLCSLWNNLTFQWIDLRFNYSNRTIRVVSLTLADIAFKVDKYFCSSENVMYWNDVTGLLLKLNFIFPHLCTEYKLY